MSFRVLQCHLMQGLKRRACVETHSQRFEGRHHATCPHCCRPHPQTCACPVFPVSISAGWHSTDLNLGIRNDLPPLPQVTQQDPVDFAPRHLLPNPSTSLQSCCCEPLPICHLCHQAHCLARGGGTIYIFLKSVSLSVKTISGDNRQTTRL